MKALCFSKFGGPEVLEIRELPNPEPRPGHAIVRLQAIGLNFADVYRFMAFAAEFRDVADVPADLPPRLAC